MGDSKKYPYHTTDGFSEFRGKGGGFFELEIRRHGGILTIGIPKAWGGLDLGFPQETDKIVFLENANFMDFNISSQIKHKLTTLLTTAEAGYKTSTDRSDVFVFTCRKKPTKRRLYIKLQRP